MVVLIIGTLIFNSILESRSLKLEERNSRTEYNNNQYTAKKKLRIKELYCWTKRIESERIEKERKLTINDRLSEIKKLLLRVQFEQFKIRNDAQEFQF
jgi:hypothetical protein